MAGAGAGVEIEPPPAPYELLGALVATGALRAILDAASERITTSAKVANARRLVLLGSFIDDVAAADVGRRAALLGAGPPLAGRYGLSFDTAQTTPRQAVSMAERYLLSDTSFRESWETHREGMLGLPVVSSMFPAGLILEIMCRRGHPLSPEVDRFLSAADSKSYRY